MAERLRDILFPLNVRGNDRRVVASDLMSIPNNTLAWMGEELRAMWTSQDIATGRIDQHSQTFKNGDGSTFVIDYGNTPQRRTLSPMFFSCTNVTSLVYNGETLI